MYQSIEDKLRHGVLVSVRDSVRDSVWSSVGDSVRSSVGDCVWDIVWGSISYYAREELREYEPFGDDYV